MLAHTTRALQLLLQAIREVDTLEELERLRATAAELYAADAETLGELTRAIEARGVVLRTQLRLFPTPPVEPPDAVKGPADPDLVREWCEQVHQMGPDELDAIEQLTHAHWDRASLRELRAAIAHRRRQLGW